jgi:PAS domain S-box-containing protein
MLGYAPGELVGLPVDALVPDAIRPRHAAWRAAYAKAPRARPMGTQMDLVARRRDGSEVMVEIALSPLQGEGLPYVVAAMRDIGAYPRVRQALQRARYSECVADLGRLAVDMREPEPLLERVPAAAAEALQVERAAVLLLAPNRLEFRLAGGYGLEASDPGLVPNRADTLPGRAFAAAAPQIVADWTEELYMPPDARAAGLRSALAVPMSDRGSVIGVLAAASTQPRRFAGDEVHFLGSLANLLVASLQRVHTEEALAHAQRLESVGQLTGGIAHDFNNLLTVIQGNLQILEEHPALADDTWAQHLVAAAARASRRGADLTGKLLAFSRRQMLQPSRVDVGAMLESLADMLHRTIDQRIEIAVEVEPGLPPCRADAGQLDASLLNIAINARDAMPEGGRLGFSARRCGALPAALAADLEAGRGYVAIAVADSGCGMPEHVKERAFEPFFTTKDAGRGTGLGLSTVYGFARQSNGGVTLDSAPGAGTTVTLYLPAYSAEAASEDADTSAREVLPPGLRVLLVEDEPEVREVAATFLAALGCAVTSCPDAEQALAVLTERGDFDLLLSDIALGPGLRGTELARRALVHSPELAVLLVSGFASDQLGADASFDGAPWEVLRKPYSRQELARAIARALAAVR